MSYELIRQIKSLANNGRVILRIKVKPGAIKDNIIGWMADETLKVAVASAPERGKANNALVAFLAGEFGISRAGVTILSGQNSRTKLIKIVLNKI